MTSTLLPPLPSLQAICTRVAVPVKLAMEFFRLACVFCISRTDSMIQSFETTLWMTSELADDKLGGMVLKPDRWGAVLPPTSFALLLFFDLSPSPPPPPVLFFDEVRFVDTSVIGASASPRLTMFLVFSGKVH